MPTKHTAALFTFHALPSFPPTNFTTAMSCLMLAKVNPACSPKVEKHRFRRIFIESGSDSQEWKYHLRNLNVGVFVTLTLTLEMYFQTLLFNNLPAYFTHCTVFYDQIICRSQLYYLEKSWHILIHVMWTVIILKFNINMYSSICDYTHVMSRDVCVGEGLADIILSCI